MMFKSLFAGKPALALAAILALGSLSLAADASAKGGGHGWVWSDVYGEYVWRCD